MGSQFYTSAGPIRLEALISGTSATLDEADQGQTGITGVAPLADSQKGELAFLSSKRSVDALASAGASAVIVTAELSEHVRAKGMVAVVSPTPKAHFSRALAKLYKRNDSAESIVHASADVHPTAIIAPGVQVGAGTQVGPYAVIESAVVGEDCVIKSHAAIGGSGFSADRDELGVVSAMHIGRVVVGDRVHIGSHTCIDRGFIGDTIIEDDVKIDNLVQIGHNCRVGARTVMAGFVGISGSCDIGEDVSMGGQVGLADHLKVGDGASLGALSGVMNDIPAGEYWMGYPATRAREYMREIATLRKLAKTNKRSSKR